MLHRSQIYSDDEPTFAFADVANIHWNGGSDELIDWGGAPADVGETVQYLQPSITPTNVDIRDPFNNGSGTRESTATHGWTDKDGLRINAFGSQYFTKLSGVDEPPTNYLSTTKYMLYMAGTRHSATQDDTWGTNGSTPIIRITATGIRFTHDDGSAHNYDFEVGINGKFTVVAGYENGKLTVYGNGVLLADEVSVSAISSLGSDGGPKLQYTGGDYTSVVLGAGKIIGTKAAASSISAILETARAA